jgi:hypothetical protein
MTTTLDLRRAEFWKLDDVDAELRRGYDMTRASWRRRSAGARCRRAR